MQTVNSLWFTAFKHPCANEIRADNCGFNTSLPQVPQLRYQSLKKADSCKFTCTVICKMREKHVSSIITCIQQDIRDWRSNSLLLASKDFARTQWHNHPCLFNLFNSTVRPELFTHWKVIWSVTCPNPTQ